MCLKMRRIYGTLWMNTFKELGFFSARRRPRIYGTLWMNTFWRVLLHMPWDASHIDMMRRDTIISGINPQCKRSHLWSPVMNVHISMNFWNIRMQVLAYNASYIRGQCRKVLHRADKQHAVALKIDQTDWHRSEPSSRTLLWDEHSHRSTCYRF